MVAGHDVSDVEGGDREVGMGDVDLSATSDLSFEPIVHVLATHKHHTTLTCSTLIY